MQSQIFMLVMVFTAALRAWEEFDQSKPSTWIFITGLIGVILVSVGFYIYMERQRSPVKV